MPPDLSIVVPVYNSSRIFPELYKRLVDVLEAKKVFFEIVAVIDGSPDDAAVVIASFSQRDQRVKMVEFSRNFGHQASVSAGLMYATGELVVIMDDDLEDPPEIIPEFIDASREGYDVVYGIRKARKVSAVKRMAYYTFYRILNQLADIDLPLDAGDFCLMRRCVVDKLKAMPERNRYVRGLRTWVGFRQIGLEYERGKRMCGKSGYSLSKYIRLAVNAMFSFSYTPLYFFSYFGFVTAFTGFFLGLVLILKKLLGHSIQVAGWVSMMVAVLFLGGIQLIFVGILGQYIARIYDEVKSRPHFVVKNVMGFDSDAREGRTHAIREGMKG